MTAKLKSKLKEKNTLIFIISLILLALLFFIFPLLGDDLLHGSIGVGLHFMQSVNGRYLGNLFGINLTSNLFLRISIKLLVIGAIIYLTYKIIESKEKIFLIIPIVLLLAMPKEIFRQVIVFTSGFGNYVIPLVGILTIFLIHLKNIELSNKWIIPLTLLGIVNSLFVEHVTIFNLLLSIYLLIYAFKKKQKNKLIYVFYALGSIIGSCLMFTNPIYLSSFAGDDTYRSLSSNLKGILFKFCQIVKEAFYNNHVIMGLLFFLFFIILSKSKSKHKKLICLIKGYFILFITFYILRIFNPNWLVGFEYYNYLEAFLTILYFSAMIISIIISGFDKKFKYKCLFYLASFVIILSPLLIVNPIGPRCYFPAYGILVLLVCEILSEFDNRKIWDINKIGYIVYGSLLVLFIFYFTIYGEVYLANRRRDNYISSSIANGEKEVNFYLLPHYEYLHGADICPEYNEMVYRVYHKIDDNIVFRKDCEE